MSERKVLNKYYPPDFDPRKIPRMRLPKNRQYTVRIMTPFNMKCKTCGDYIAKAKKFNARKETVESESYLGLKIFRFYFKCPTCMAEITFKTDPKNCDYELEHGAIRNFDAFRKAQEMAEKQARDEEEEENMNIMKKLEKRTKASRREMEQLEELEEIKDINEKKVKVDHEDLLEDQKNKMKKLEEEIKQRQEDEDNAVIKELERYQKKNVVACEVEEEIIEEIDDEDSQESFEHPSSSSSSFFDSDRFDLVKNAKKPESLKRKINSLVKVKSNESEPPQENPEKKLKNLCAYSDSDDSEDPD